jgi:hypothetical protein
MWLTKFFDIISRFSASNPLAGIEEALARLDPDKIYVENVRSVLSISHPAAVKICETAVRQGVFIRGIEILSPDGSVAATVSKENELPTTIRCWTKADEHYEEIEFPTERLEKVTFYRLNDAAANHLVHA